LEKRIYQLDSELIPISIDRGIKWAFTRSGFKLSRRGNPKLNVNKKFLSDIKLIRITINGYGVVTANEICHQ
jgi:hypothetical protein